MRGWWAQSHHGEGKIATEVSNTKMSSECVFKGGFQSVRENWIELKSEGEWKPYVKQGP